MTISPHGDDVFDDPKYFSKMQREVAVTLFIWSYTLIIFAICISAVIHFEQLHTEKFAGKILPTAGN